MRIHEPGKMNQAQLSSAMQLAHQHEQTGRIGEAESIYRNIIANFPRYHPAFQAYALLVYGAGNLPLAADLFKAAIALDGNVAVYYRNYGEICRRLGRFDEAIAAGQQACRLSHADIDAHFNLALAFSDAHDDVGAGKTYRRVLDLLAPQLATGVPLPRMWNMRGNALHRLSEFEAARQSYERALELQPDFPVALNALGSLFADTGALSEAHACFAKAIKLVPEFAEARLNLGMAQLKLGDWQVGWDNYEARWNGSAEHNNGTYARPHCPLPQWNGEGETSQQALLVIAEQGFGDTLQFSRYLKLAMQRFGKIGFVCPQLNLHLLMERSFGEQVVLLKRMPIDYTGWHWQCPLLSMPRAFQTRVDTVPAQIPYLLVSTQASAHWRSRLDASTPGIRVGVAWTGRRSHQYDTRRSLRSTQLLPLLKVPGITWVSLQKLGEGEARPMIPQGAKWIDWSEELYDFDDTAALVANLDLVISIDSAIAHLAGALARPVWLLNRFDGEWRWLEQREDSAWYPTMRIFNQPRYGDWDSVLAAVQAALAALPR
jgi:tetratricopeptide (TPR) repeat protein